MNKKEKKFDFVPIHTYKLLKDMHIQGKSPKPEKKVRIEEKIEEVLRNRILDITDEYRGRSFKEKDGIQVYLGYPQQLIDELLKVLNSR